jgi:hypothetical protein
MSQTVKVVMNKNLNYKRRSSKYRLNSQTKQPPIFPVEISHTEPTVVLPSKKSTMQKPRRRKLTRAHGENPRAKGTNPRAKK